MKIAHMEYTRKGKEFGTPLGTDSLVINKCVWLAWSHEVRVISVITHLPSSQYAASALPTSKNIACRDIEHTGDP